MALSIIRGAPIMGSKFAAVPLRGERPAACRGGTSARSLAYPLLPQPLVVAIQEAGEARQRGGLTLGLQGMGERPDGIRLGSSQINRRIGEPSRRVALGDVDGLRRQ